MLAIMVVLSQASIYDPLQALPAVPSTPLENPITAAKATLGKQLYFDARLSRNDTHSCNSCHILAGGGADHQPLSVGALGQSARRSIPGIWNAAFQSVQFWDGRADSLEDAIKDHLIDPAIMGLPTPRDAEIKIKSSAAYQERFAQLFPGADPLNYDTLAQAIATYLRTLVTPNSPFDRYVKGDSNALSAAALRGLKEYEAAGCTACHFGANFSGPPVPRGEGFYELFPNYIGSQYDKKYQLLTDDLGRFEVTGEEIHKRLWRVPTLRNIALTAPYFHNGSVTTLDEAVRVMAMTQLKKTLTQRQVKYIVTFLESLTGQFPVGYSQDLQP